MTKEQLEERFDVVFDKYTAPTGGGYEADFTDKWEFYKEFEKSIDEYAKLVAVEFNNFISNHKLDFQTAGKNRWIGLDMKYYTTEELYLMFIEGRK